MTIDNVIHIKHNPRSTHFHSITFSCFIFIFFLFFFIFFLPSQNAKDESCLPRNASADAVKKHRGQSDLQISRTESLRPPLRPEEPLWSACPWRGGASAGWCPSKLEVCFYVIFSPTVTLIIDIRYHTSTHSPVSLIERP